MSSWLLSHVLFTSSRSVGPLETVRVGFPKGKSYRVTAPSEAEETNLAYLAITPLV